MPSTRVFSIRLIDFIVTVIVYFVTEFCGEWVDVCVVVIAVIPVIPLISKGPWKSCQTYIYIRRMPRRIGQ